MSENTSAQLGKFLPVYSIFPFVVMLLCIAVLPLVAHKFWDNNRNKLAISLVLGLPIAVWMATLDVSLVGHTALEYFSFVVLLGTLFAISGGIVVRGNLAGTPGLNTIILLIGSVLASLIGTTGASMLLIRPLLRANSFRKQKAHVVIFFIFTVSNIGGLLTPLGDPPLFLGFLRGVPFFWTLHLWSVWAFCLATLLILFFIVDSTLFRKEDLQRHIDLDQAVVERAVPVHLVGSINFVYLALVILVILWSGFHPLPTGVREAALIFLAYLSLKTTPHLLRVENSFTWAPMVEVASIFAGVFATMIPALAILNAWGPESGLTQPWHYFWASGLLSSILDNAPTYLAFASSASGYLGTDASSLAGLLQRPEGEYLLRAVSLGSVLMGANTYIGNGPNFMVKAVAESSGVAMPSFFRYMAWSGAILLPLFGVVTRLFLF